ncbi:MAG: HD domain-containing phosphohydrolase [Dehalococcoidia bacterium]|nr:HD domain-containing phosphohydrolase [Dehalococcoidia bacterium]
MDGIGVPAEIGTISRPQMENDNGYARPSLTPILEQVQRTCELAWEHGTQLSVVVAGLDGFRMVNDCLGPIEGDAVLSAFAACVGDRVEQVAHLGGDQLIGILPATEAATAVVLAEGLREDVARGILTAMGKLTASFGVAVYPSTVETARELVYGAQAAMYWAKAMGGNRVGYWGEMIGANGWGRPGGATDPVGALAAALERKIRAASGQLGRSAWYAAKVAAEMGLGVGEQELVERAALLHDAGKLAVPDYVLQKPGGLSERERAMVKAHPEVGARIAARLPDMAAAASIIAHHHEHYDGSGYPDGLAGDDIPLGSRIILVSDAFDAMTTYRSYKSVISLQEALQELHRCSGQQFDRRVVDAFIAIVSRQGLNALHWSQSRR